MAEKVELLGVNRDRDYMYYIKDGAVWRVQRKRPGVPKGRPEKIADGTFMMDTDYIYYVDREGDVSRATRAEASLKAPTRRPVPVSKRRLLNQPRPFEAGKLGLKISSYQRYADPEQTAALMEKATNGHRRILSRLAERLTDLRWTHVEHSAGGFDMWATAPNGKRVIFEAKTTTPASKDGQVRSAVGQLFEYRHFHGKPNDLLAVVTDRRIGKERVDFLHSLKISALFVTAGRVGSEDLVAPTLRGFRNPTTRRKV